MKKRFTFLIAALAAILMMALPEKVVGQAPINTILWSEDFSSYANSAVPSGSVTNSQSGTTVYGGLTLTYACEVSGTQIYTSGGPSSGNNLLIKYNNGSFTVSGISTGGASELTLSYAKGGSGTLSVSVTSSPTGASISGSTITTNGASTIDITFKNTHGSKNLRLDDPTIKVKTAGSSDEATSVVINHSEVKNNIYGDNTDGGSFSATVLDSSDEEIDGATVSWSSSNTGVASINSSTGAVTLCAVGSTTITASYAGSSGNYQSSFATYELNVINEDPSLVIIWSEDFSSYAANDVPSGGDYSYVCTNGGGTTKIYAETNAGGTSPELLVAKTNGTFTATIPLLTSNYGYSGDLTLKYKQNANSLNVKTTTSGITVYGEESEGAGITNNTVGEKTITFKGVTTLTENITIVFTATTGSNVRLDDIVLKGTQAALTKVATPVITPASGAVAYGTEVTITCATEDASIYYTMGATPADPTSSSALYEHANKPAITEGTTIKAIAVKDGLTDSEVATVTYTIAEPCATPTFSVAAGEVEKGTTVEISTETEDATIYYTTDGTSPTTSSTTYSSAITINSAMTIKAIAVKEGNANSEVASAAYTVIDYATLPFIWVGGTNSALTALTGVTASGLGSDYAEQNAPYRVKMDGAGDYIEIKTDSQPSCVTIGVKMLGGGTTSKIKIQESADGSDFTDVEEFTISGSQNDILTFTTTTIFKDATRYVKIVKSVHGSNIGVGPISIYKNMPAPDVNGNNEIVSDVTIGNGEYLIISSLIKIPNGKKITVSNNGVLVNTTAANLVIEDGGQLIVPTGTEVAATFRKEMPEAPADKDDVTVTGWKLISSPTNNGTTADQAYENFGDVNNLVDDAGYLLYNYDEENRIWRSLHTTVNTYTQLNVGQGYLYGNTGKAIEFTGNVNSAASYSVALSYNAKDSDNLAGFNLIGNPYSHDIYKGVGGAIDNSKLAEGYYTIENSNWTAKLGFETPIKPGQGILVKTTEAFDLTITNTTAAATAEKANRDNLMFRVENSEYSDVAYALFDKGYGLNKINHRGDMVPMLYISQNGENYAIAMMDDNTNSFNLGFEAKTTAKYTLTYKAKGEFNYLHVIDRMTGEDIDMLLEGEYSFVGSPQDDNNRFIVRLGYLPNYDDNGEDTFAYQNGSDIVVSGEGELQIFDVMGRKVASITINGVETVNIPTQGVYIMKLNEKTQKIVVR